MSRSGSRRLLWIGAAVALALATLVGAYRWLHGRPPPERFETAAVDTGTIVSKVTATGALSALVTVQVGSQVSGRLSEILVDYNSPVTKGQLIARIDPQLFNANVQQNRAALLTAEAGLAKDEVTARDTARTFKRQQTLREQNLVAQQDVDTAETNAMAAAAQLKADAANIAMSRANLTQSELNLEYTMIHAPISGTVISKAVDVGQTVAASFQAPTLFTIAQDLTHMQVDTNISESDVGKLKSGMKASFTVDAYPNERFEGTIRQIRNAAQTLQNVVTYDAVIDVENPGLKLRPGMTANVTVVSETRPDVPRLPNAALRFRPPPDLVAPARHGEADAGALLDVPGTRTVYVLKGEKPQPTRIRVGITDGSFTEIAEGKLAPGDRLVTAVAPGSDPRTARLRSPF